MMRVNFHFVAVKTRRPLMPKNTRIVMIVLLMVIFSTTMYASHFGTPDKEELAMTSVPGYPGAAAVVLEREEITTDDKGERSIYERIKILTEEGKKYANVSVQLFNYSDDLTVRTNHTINAITARTIHADGTVVPFTGKPYLKTLEKGTETDGFDYSVQEKVFTLPDVEVGSIIEYSYNFTYAGPPDWFIQGKLYVKTAHYLWHATHLQFETLGGDPATVNWFQILPPGVTLQHPGTPGVRNYELTVKDVPPEEEEEYMPPLANYSYRVIFYYSPWHNANEYWTEEGKLWSKRENSFIAAKKLGPATQDLIKDANTADEKLRKIYAFVQSLENTDFTRTHSKKEDKDAGLKTDSAADVLTNKRGSGEELTDLFVGMARAAGLKAYVMLVPDRSKRFYEPSWLSLYQFDNSIAVVNVDGKDQYLDPGSKGCPYGHLAWQNTFVTGLRQTETGTEVVKTPGAGYADNKTAHIAILTMHEDGSVKGTISATYSGAAALDWRQRALREDNKSLLHALQKSMEELVPETLQVEVSQIENLQDSHQPLKISYDVTGSLGTATGKRMLIPVDIFVARRKATFPDAKREQPVYFHYPEQVQDAVRINLPKGVTVEASPEAAKIPFADMGVYSLSVAAASDNVTVRRSYTINTFLFSAKEYPSLRSFYSQFQSKDQETIVLKTNAAMADKGAPIGN